MLVKFAIDPAIVTEEDYPPIVHERLQRLWVKDRLGVLVDTLWEGQLNTYEAFKSIENKDIRDKWLVMYRKAREVGLLQAVPAKRRISGGYDNDDIETLANHINVLPDTGVGGLNLGWAAHLSHLGAVVGPRVA